MYVPATAQEYYYPLQFLKCPTKKQAKIICNSLKKYNYRIPTLYYRQKLLEPSVKFLLY